MTGKWILVGMLVLVVGAAMTLIVATLVVLR